MISQNYPNPFNSTTTIRVFVPEVSNASLAIFDILGRKIANLADGTLSEGWHNFIWDATNVSSGIYLSRLVLKNVQRHSKIMIQK
jgi:hypothetical protein